jgi:nucleotide sugar dehydrogenase
MIGAYTQSDFEMIKEVWRSVISGSVQFYSFLPEELEVAKLCLNVWLSIQITVANVIGELCKKVKVSPQKILEVMWKDMRNYSPGLGFSGVCLPRDVNCFKYTCVEHLVGNGHRLANFLNDLNNYTVLEYVRKIESYSFKKVGILGVAYKAGVSYTDESQSIKIAKKLLADGYEVYVYDPLAKENAKKELTGKVFFCSCENECIEKSNVILLERAILKA